MISPQYFRTDTLTFHLDMKRVAVLGWTKYHIISLLVNNFGLVNNFSATRCDVVIVRISTYYIISVRTTLSKS